MKFGKYFLNDKAFKYSVINFCVMIIFCLAEKFEDNIIGFFSVYIIFIAPILSVKGINNELNKLKDVNDDTILKRKILINIWLNAIYLIIIVAMVVYTFFFN